MKKLIKFLLACATASVAFAQVPIAIRYNPSTGYTTEPPLLRFPDMGIAIGAATPGTFTGSAGLLTIASGGVNQNLALNASGTGDILLNGAGTAGQFVGIGTTVPTYPLTVSGPTATGIAIENADSGGKQWRLAVTGTSFGVLETAVGEHLTVLAGGNVGIGTASPAQLLSLNTTSGNTPMSFERSGNVFGVIGLTQANNYIIGATNDDLFIRANGENILFSTDGGTSAQMVLTNSGAKTLLGSTTDTTGKLQVTATSGPQIAALYDASNYATMTVGSTGATTLDAVGAGAAFYFADDVIVGNTGNTTIPDGNGGTFIPQSFVSNTSGIVGFGLNVADGVDNRRAGLFLNDTNSVWGLSHTYSANALPFVLVIGATEHIRVDPNAGTTTFNQGTASTSKDTGALVVEGGVGVEQMVNASTYGGAIQALSGAGAANVTQLTTAITTVGGDGADAITLADGVEGQIKILTHVVDADDAVITPTTKTGFTSVTFDAVGDSVTMQFHTTLGWMITSNYNATVTP